MMLKMTLVFEKDIKNYTVKYATSEIKSILFLPKQNLVQLVPTSDVADKHFRVSPDFNEKNS